MTDEKQLIEALADFEHNRWSRWQSYLFDNSIKNEDGTVTIPKEFVDRWNRQIATQYADLSESEKDSDRKEAIRILECVKKHN